MSNESAEVVDRAIIDLLDWIKNRPTWHADALIQASSGVLNSEEVVKFADKCIVEAQASNSQKRKVTVQELSVTTSTAPPVTLTRISKVQNVNRLAANQVLQFAPLGLTVIYGGNGTGKSGYTRLLRQVCEVRGLPGRVLPDIYSRRKEGPKASISWSIGDGEETCEWKDGNAPAAELKNVSVFDSKAADHHIQDGAQAAYTPEALRLLENLGYALSQVEAELQRRIDVEETNAVLVPVFNEESELVDLMSDLGQKDTESRIRKAALLSPEETERLAELSKLLEDIAKTDPSIKVASLKRLVEEAGDLVEKLTHLGQLLGNSEIDRAREKAKLVTEATKVAEASAALLSGMEIPDLGSAGWKILWDAARRFSEASAYPGHDFPHVEGDARCVLCQQLLGHEAKNRMVSLEKYVNDTAQRDLEMVQADSTALVEAIREEVDVKTQTLIVSAELAAQCCEVRLPTLLASIANAAKSRLSFIQNLIVEPTEFRKVLIDDLVRDISFVVGTIQAAADTWALQIDDLTGLCDEDGQAKIRREHRNLMDRSELAANLDSVLAENLRRERLRKLKDAIATTKRNAVTQQHGKLSQQLVTDKLQEMFNDELQQLGAGRLRVSIVRARSSNASSSFKLTFDGVDSRTALSEVFSEGECRIIGLARFLTEIKYSKSRAGIVMDDPVSSLDHKYRARVAKRLAVESLQRQVVIFTHDIAFLEQLNNAAPHVGADITLRVVENTLKGAGTCSGTLPPYGANLGKRLGYIRDYLQRYEKYWNSEADKEWREASETLVRELRKAWERAVEEILFNDVVTRFERAVQTNRVREVVVDDSDWSAIENAMTELSRVGPHDEPSAAQDEPLSPADVRLLIQDLENWKKDVESRRKVTGKRRPKVTEKV